MQTACQQQPAGCILSRIQSPACAISVFEQTFLFIVTYETKFRAQNNDEIWLVFNLGRLRRRRRNFASKSDDDELVVKEE
jgi:hypothetical protein